MSQTSPDTAETAEPGPKPFPGGYKKVDSRPKKLPVMEIFGPTIQGEGAMAGLRTTFIRFGLCDYKCVMCDSMHAVDPKKVSANARWMIPHEIVAEWDPLMDGCNWVTFSGGNPAMHDLTELVDIIKWNTGLRYKIAVETQGTLLPSWLHRCDNVTVSPKGPGMGEQFEEDKFNEYLRQFVNHKGFNVKVVVFSAADLEFARYINSQMQEWGLEDQMYLSLGNPWPPGKESELSGLNEGAYEFIGDTDRLKLKLLDEHRQIIEDLMQIPHLRNVRVLPQLHVLWWGNKLGV